MWISGRGRRRTETGQAAALVGRVHPCPARPSRGVSGRRKRRELPCLAQAAMCGSRRRDWLRCWCSRPVRRGEGAPCWPAEACLGRTGTWRPERVLIYSGSASIRGIGGGGIRLTGDVLVNGSRLNPTGRLSMELMVRNGDYVGDGAGGPAGGRDGRAAAAWVLSTVIPRGSFRCCLPLGSRLHRLLAGNPSPLSGRTGQQYV